MWKMSEHLQRGEREHGHFWAPRVQTGGEAFELRPRPFGEASPYKNTPQSEGRLMLNGSYEQRPFWFFAALKTKAVEYN